MKNSIITLFLVHLVFFGFSQDIGYDVSGIYNNRIVKEKLDAAKTISDINPGYPSSWISRYISVEVTATNDGKILSASSTNDKLNKDQLKLLKMVETGSDITVVVKYYHEKSTNDSDVKMINFSVTVVPEIEAEYPGGYQLLKQYLKENAIDRIPETIARQLGQAIVSFTINEEGQVTNTQVTKSSGNEVIDKLLLQTVDKMQDWKPAQNSNGIKVKQKFELNVGNIDGC